jgi:signal transduction histidine kinase
LSASVDSPEAVRVGTVTLVSSQTGEPAEISVPSINDTLRRIVLVFRVLGWLWMTLLVLTTLITDADANRTVVIAAEALATMWTLATIWAARTPGIMGSRWFWLADGGVALLVASASFIAGAEDLFHGGYPISWLAVAAYAQGLPGSLGASLVLASQQVIGFLVEGRRSMVATIGSAVFIVFGVILGWTFDTLRRNDAERRAAEQRLEEARADRTRQEERVALANQLHDSILQTLHIIRTDADDPDRVRYLARREERSMYRMISDFASPYEDGFRSSLFAARDDVEDLYPVEIRAVVRDDAAMTAELTAVVDATREAMTNAARHSGDSAFDLYAEISAGGVRVYVRDRGVGFDPSVAHPRHGMTHSIRERVAGVGGSATITSTPGAGTEVEISVVVEP